MAELEPNRMVAKYKCPECGKKWKGVNSLGGPKQCITCKGPFLKPYKTRPIKEKDLKPKRKFGKFYCSCGNHWASGNAWIGKWQECRDCGNKVMPRDLRPLRPSKHFTTQKPHDTERCQKCIELGHNCRDYVPPAGDAAVDIPDDQSIISEASTASSSSWADEQQLSDEDHTPVASEGEEDIDKFLDSQMKSLNLKDS